MNDFDVVSVPSFSDFVAEVPVSTVRLCLGERYAPDQYGSGERSFTVPAKRLSLDLQGFNDRGDLVWASEDHKVQWGHDGPAMPSDKAIYAGMGRLFCIVSDELQSLGYQVLPGRYVLPSDRLPLNGGFDCAEWYREGDVLKIRPVAEELGDERGADSGVLAAQA